MSRTKSPRAGYPQVCPYLYYRDATAAVEWLGRCFGFEERQVFRTPEGEVVHAELVTGTGVFFVGPGLEFFGTAPVADPEAIHAGFYVYVDDIHAHLEHALKHGVTIRNEIEEKPHGDWVYVALDLEGQRWIFAQPRPA